MSPKVSFSRSTIKSQSVTPDIHSQKQFQRVEHSYSDDPSGSPQIRQSAENHVQEVPVQNVTPRGNVKQPAKSLELILPNDGELQIYVTTDVHQLEHTCVSSSSEHLFNTVSELDNESPPSPVKLTRIDSVGSEDLEVLTHEPSEQPQFTPEIVDPPFMFSGRVGEVDLLPHHCSETNVTEEEEELFNELMKSDLELPCPQSEDIENVYDTPESNLSRNGEDMMKSILEHFPKSAFPVDGDEQTKGMPSEMLHASPVESVQNVEAATPKASPFAIHRQTVQSHVSQLSPDSDDLQVTPTASPHGNRRLTSGKGVSSSESSCEDASSIIEPPLEFKSGKIPLESIPGTESPSLPFPPGFDDEIHPVIEKTEPLLRIPRTSIARRHSFGSRTRSMFIHRRGGSHSDSNSPNRSPAMQLDKKVTKNPQPKSATISVLRRHHSEVHKKRPISVLGLISTTRSDLSLEDLPSVCNEPDTDLLVPSDTILPPPQQFEEPISLPVQQNKASSRKYHSLPRISPQESPIAQIRSVQPSPPKEKRSNDHSSKHLLWFQRHRKNSKPSLSPSHVISPSDKTKHVEKQEHESPPLFIPEIQENTSRKPITVIPPYEDNPEESLSFDEILASFDRYASATGKTTKQRSQRKEKIRLPSPEPKPRNKIHKRRTPRSLTISSIDADTMKAVQEALQEKKESPPPPRPRANSKVNQMAREYSRRIKDHQRRGVFKRYSTVVEEPSETNNDHSIVTKGPIWHEHSKERRTSRTLSPSSQEEPLSSPHLSQDDKQAACTRVQVEVSPKLQVLDTPEDSPHHSSKSRAQSHTHHPGVHNNKVNFDEAEFHKRGGFRGWVKSLVDKFSGSSRDKK